MTLGSLPQIPRFHNKHYEIPRNPSPVFTGREEIRERLRASCLPSSSSDSLQQKRFVIYGLGGSGKTQLCLKFAEDHRERYVSRACGVMSVCNQGPTRLQVLGHLLDRR